MHTGATKLWRRLQDDTSYILGFFADIADRIHKHQQIVKENDAP